uniref:PUM-HD domain-containing protein n=1 Tax=Leersia perrieri TaxID=77586 RepID=A0A0D9XZH4_9ORYZ
MERLLDEIPLLHHGDFLLGRCDAVADDDGGFDVSRLIRELAEMGVVDGDGDGDDEFGMLPSPLSSVAADDAAFFGSGGGGGGGGAMSPTSSLCFLSHDAFPPPSPPFSRRVNTPLPSPSVFKPFSGFYSGVLLDAAESDGWDTRCSPPPIPASNPTPAARGRSKTSRRKGERATPPAASPKKCAATARYESLAGLRGFMYHIARDQHGCRFLQQRLDDGKREVDFIFAGVARHAVELMVNPFGNYLMQKLLAVCDDEQRMAVVLTLTKDAFVLVRISLNVHGTRAVQKLIESLRTREEIQLVVEALRPGFLELIKDPNGNHVVQRCLQSFDANDNKPIFEAAAVHCLDIGMQCHGCCVLQRCIARSGGEQREKLVAAIASNGFELAQDAYGNYVVQYVIDLKVPAANASLTKQFQGRYIHLSMQKFSSNVVEKCLKVFKEADKATIILELLAVPHFEQLLQHPFANYVIYSAIQNSKGSLHSALTNAIRPHVELLRTSPYCKRIYSRALLKK